jgi:hypothetical protein
MSCCQSRLLRARETFWAATAPTFPRQHLGHHPLESSAGDGTGRRPAEIAIDDLGVVLVKVVQPVPHDVLQDPPLLIVHHLVRRGLSYVQDRLAAEMMRFDLVTHHRPRPVRRCHQTAHFCPTNGGF